MISGPTAANSAAFMFVLAMPSVDTIDPIGVCAGREVTGVMFSVTMPGYSVRNDVHRFKKKVQSANVIRYYDRTYATMVPSMVHGM